MKRFLITYTRSPESGTEADWHAHIAEFIAALEADPELKGRVLYRCMKTKDGNYFHLAEAVDAAAPDVLNQRAFFKRYTEESKRVAAGTLKVTPLETIAESKR